MSLTGALHTICCDIVSALHEKTAKVVCDFSFSVYFLHIRNLSSPSLEQESICIALFTIDTVPGVLLHRFDPLLCHGHNSQFDSLDYWMGVGS